MIPLDVLQSDHAIITKILQDRRAVSTEKIPFGMRKFWQFYLLSLEYALKMLDSLINYLTPK